MPARDESEACLPDELFALADEGEHEPREIADRLVSGYEMFNDLRTGEALILFLMRTETKVKGGKAILGEMCLPRFQGGLASLGTWLLAKVCGEMPDFIMLLDSEWWTQADPRKREALVFHELKHACIKRDKEGEPKFKDDGSPVWDIQAHDIEDFDDVARRYGRWSESIICFERALQESDDASAA